MLWAGLRRWSWVVVAGILGGLASWCAAREGDEVLGLTISLIKEKDKDLRALGFEQVRTQAKGKAATEKFAALLPALTPEAQVGLLSALADRGDAAARPAVVELFAATKDADVKVATIKALGLIGDASDVAKLVSLLEKGMKHEYTSAIASLGQLPGEPVSRAILAEWKNATGPIRIVLIDILLTRRAKESIPTLLEVSTGDEPTIRTAAMAALGQLADAEHIPAMVEGLLASSPGSERVAAERAIAAVAARIEDPAKRADPLLAIMAKQSSDDYRALLPTLGRIGGPAARKAVEAALASKDNGQRFAGLLALCNWPDASTFDRLMQIATEDEQANYRNLAFRALIRVAPLPDSRSNPDRLAATKKVLAMCTSDNERRLVIERTRAIRSLEALRFVVPYMDQPTFAQKACETVVELAHHRELRSSATAEFHAALDKVIATSKDPVVIDRAKRYKNNETWVRPKAEAN